MKTIVIDEKSHVSASELEREAGIAIKALPGRSEWVVCIEERCALITEVRERNGEQFIEVAALAGALNLEVEVELESAAVRFRFRDAPGGEDGGEARLGVGQLAPNIKLPRLDGTFISLAELRGRRVLINSWASW